MTVTTSSDGSKTWVFFLLLLLLLFFLMAMPALEWSDHAVQKHGPDAIKARQANMGGGQRYDCRDGKQYWVAPYGDKYAITVAEGGREKTSFITRSWNYIKKALERDDCRRMP